MSAERVLLWAVLDRAIFDAACIGVKMKGQRKWTARARAWLFGWKWEDSIEPFTYPWVCSELNLCPLETKRKIRRIIESGTLKPMDGHSFVSSRLADFFEQRHSATEAEVYNL